jgi:hypothetical protein
VESAPPPSLRPLWHRALNVLPCHTR